MRGLIKSIVSGKFLKPKDTRSKDTSHVQSFPDLNTAIKAEHEFGLMTGELILIMGDQPSDITIDLDLEELDT